MNRQKISQWMIIVILVVAMAAFGAVVSAQEVTPEPSVMDGAIFEIEGFITEINGDVITVNGEMIDISSATFSSDVTVAVGQAVEVLAMMENDAFIGLHVDDIDNDDIDDEIDVYGIIESIDGTLVTVGGMVFDLTNADVSGSGDFIDFSLLTVGDPLKLELVRSSTGWTVHEIKFEALDEDGFHFGDDMDGSDDDNGFDGFARRDDDVPADVDPTITAAEAAAIALEVYPNTTVREIQLDLRYGNVLVWEVELFNGAEIYVDATTGVRLEIEDGSSSGSDDRDDDHGDDDSDRDDDHDDDYSDDDDDEYDDDYSDDDDEYDDGYSDDDHDDDDDRSGSNSGSDDDHDDDDDDDDHEDDHDDD